MATRTVHDFATGETPSAATFDELPKGWQGYAELTSNVGSITGTETTLTGLSLTITALASRRLEVKTFLQIQSTVAADIVRIRLKQDGTTIAKGDYIIPTTSGYEYGMSVLTTVTPSAGSHTYIVTVERINGTGTLQVTSSSTAPACHVITDIGPAS